MSLNGLRELLERHARPDGTTAIDGVRICKVDHTVPPQSSMSGTVLAVVAQGAKRLALGDRVYDYGAGQYLVASVDLPVTGHVIDADRGRPALGFGMTLEPAAIAELLLRAEPGDLPRSTGTARPGIAVSDAPGELRRHLAGAAPARPPTGPEGTGTAGQARDPLVVGDRGTR